MEQGNDQREQSTLNNSSLFCRQFNVPDDVCQNLRVILIDLQADKDRRGRKKARDQKGKRRTKRTHITIIPFANVSTNLSST